MAVYEVGYCTREEVKRALDFKRANAAALIIDRAIETGARNIDDTMHRVFYPTDDTRFIDWPNFQYAAPWRVYLKDNELASWPAVSVSAGTQAIPLNQIFPGPWQNRPGPPWTFLELDRSTSAAFGGNSQTPQRSIVIQGTFGFDMTWDQAATLVNSINASVTTAVVSDSSHLAPGVVILMGTERMLVQDSAMTSTSLTLSGTGCNLASANDTVLVTSGSGALQLYETIQIDAERMLITDTFPTGGFVVKRGYDGTLLTTHVAGAQINAPRSLTVARGLLGTTAASQNSNGAVSRLRVPSSIRDLNIGLATVQITGEPSAWAGEPQAGNQKTQQAGGGLQSQWDKAVKRYRRNARMTAI